MTVKELKEKLNQLDDNLIVMIPNGEFYSGDSLFECVVATNVCHGVNEFDGYVFIDDYEEVDCDTCIYYNTDRNDQPCRGCVDWENWEAAENKCAGCVYEDADGSTEDIGYCVCCSRMVDTAKNDYYRKK